MTTPLLPSRAGGGAPSLPLGTGSIGSVMDCTSDQNRFALVQIHTAKCSKCDRRNMAVMRRCPGCTYQVCQPCINNDGAAAFDHGNAGSSATAGLPTTPTRKVLSRVDQGAASSSTTLPPVASLNLGLAAGSGGNGRGGEGATPIHGSVGIGAPTYQPTPGSGSGSRKRSRKAKNKAPVVDLTDSEEDFIPDLESPTARASKRRRTISKAKDPDQGGEEGTNTPSRRSARVPSATNTTHTPTKSLASPAAAKDQDSSSGNMTGFQGRIRAEQHDSENDEIGKAAGQVVGDRAVGSSSIQELLEREGVNTPTRPYREHFLSRQHPVIVNPIINVTPSRLKQRKLTEQPQKNIEEKGKERTQAPQIPIKTLRDLVESKVNVHDPDSSYKETLRSGLMKVAQELVDKYNSQMAEGVRRLLGKLYLDTEMEFFNPQQQEEIKGALRDTNAEVFKGLAEYVPRPTSSPKAGMTGAFPPSAGNTSTQPPIGYFKATPPRGRPGRGHGGSTSRQGAVTTPSPLPQMEVLGVGRAMSNHEPSTEETGVGAEGDSRPLSDAPPS